jgi:hypothetical protein
MIVCTTILSVPGNPVLSATTRQPTISSFYDVIATAITDVTAVADAEQACVGGRSDRPISADRGQSSSPFLSLMKTRER